MNSNTCITVSRLDAFYNELWGLIVAVETADDKKFREFVDMQRELYDKLSKRYDNAGMIRRWWQRVTKQEHPSNVWGRISAQDLRKTYNAYHRTMPNHPCAHRIRTETLAKMLLNVHEEVVHLSFNDYHMLLKYR